MLILLSAGLGNENQWPHPKRLLLHQSFPKANVKRQNPNFDNSGIATLTITKRHKLIEDDDTIVAASNGGVGLTREHMDLETNQEQMVETKPNQSHRDQ